MGHEGKLSRIESKNYLPSTNVTQPFERLSLGLHAEFERIIEDDSLSKLEKLQFMRLALDDKSMPFQMVNEGLDGLFEENKLDYRALNKLQKVHETYKYDDFVQRLRNISVEMTDVEF